MLTHDVSYLLRLFDVSRARGGWRALGYILLALFLLLLLLTLLGSRISAIGISWGRAACHARIQHGKWQKGPTSMGHEN